MTNSPHSGLWHLREGDRVSGLTGVRQRFTGTITSLRSHTMNHLTLCMTIATDEPVLVGGESRSSFWAEINGDTGRNQLRDGTTYQFVHPA